MVTVPHAVLLLGHGAAVQRGELHQAVQSVVSQLGVVSDLEVQFEEEFDDGGLQDELLPRGPRPQRRVLVGLEHGDQLFWQVHVDEGPKRGKGKFIAS